MQDGIGIGSIREQAINVTYANVSINYRLFSPQKPESIALDS